MLIKSPQPPLIANPVIRTDDLLDRKTSTKSAVYVGSTGLKFEDDDMMILSHDTKSAAQHHIMPTDKPDNGTSTDCTAACHSNGDITYLVRTPNGRTASASVSSSLPYDKFIRCLLETAVNRDREPSQSSSHKRTFHAAHPQASYCANKNASTSLSCSGASCDDRQVRRRLTPEKAAETALVVHNGRVLGREEYHRLQTEVSQQHHSGGFHPEVAVSLRLRLRGGTDRQNRVGSKFGGGGVSSGQNSERDRKERLRELALESVDLAKDPYLMRNHLGTYECKLCLTLHTNEGNYLAHTQGKKHQAGLAKRALMEAKLKPDTLPAPHTLAAAGASASTKHAARVKIGRPGYEISKSRDPETDQRCLSFDLHYPELDDEQQPRHRFMSAFEQRVETPPDRRYQYLLVACEPYETVAFKVPNEPIDRGEGRFVTNWDTEEKRFTLTLFYMNPEEEKS